MDSCHHLTVRRWSGCEPRLLLGASTDSGHSRHSFALVAHLGPLRQLLCRERYAWCSEPGPPNLEPGSFSPSSPRFRRQVHPRCLISPSKSIRLYHFVWLALRLPLFLSGGYPTYERHLRLCPTTLNGNGGEATTGLFCWPKGVPCLPHFWRPSLAGAWPAFPSRCGGGRA